METTSYSFSNSYVLQLTIQSAETLTATGKKPIKQKTFVVISTEDVHRGYGKQRLQQHTRNSEGGSNPIWDEKLETCIPMHTKYITLEVRCATTSKSQEKSRSIGVARVPLSDFIGNYHNNSDDYLHFLSYRLRDQFGEPNGIINFSVKVLKGLDKIQQPVEAYMYNSLSEGGSLGHHKRENYGHVSNLSWVGVKNGWRNPSNVVVGVPAHMAWSVHARV